VVRTPEGEWGSLKRKILEGCSGLAWERWGQLEGSREGRKDGGRRFAEGGRGKGERKGQVGEPKKNREKKSRTGCRRKRVSEGLQNQNCLKGRTKMRTSKYTSTKARILIFNFRVRDRLQTRGGIEELTPIEAQRAS